MTTATTKPRIRCSALPLFWACPASQDRPEGEVFINESSEAADCGTAFHRWMASHVQGTDLDPDKLAAEHGCDLDELRMLCGMGCKALNELQKHFDSADAPPMAEVALSADLGEFSLTGTADLLTRKGRAGLVLDWKTGRVDSDHTHQLRGYAWAAMDLLDGVDEVFVITVWVRQGVWDIDRLTREHLSSWGAAAGDRVRNGAGNYNPGGHCQHCQRRLSCPARTALVRSTMADLTAGGESVIAWTPETRRELGPKIGEVYGRVKMIEGVCQTFRDALRSDVGLYGPLPLGDGRCLALTPTNRRHLDAAKARPVLGGFLTPEEIDKATEISIADCEKSVAAKAPKGKAAVMKRELTEALEQAGALSVTTSHQLREQKEVENGGG